MLDSLKLRAFQTEKKVIPKNRVATLLGKTWKILKIDKLGKKYLEKPGIWEILKKKPGILNKILIKHGKFGVFNIFYLFSSKILI